MKNSIKSLRFNHSIFVLLLTVQQCLSGFPAIGNNLRETDSVQNSTEAIKFLLQSPSLWIQKSISKINNSRLDLYQNPDSATILDQLAEISNSNVMIRKNLDYNVHAFKIRQVNDLKAEIEVELKNIEHLHKKYLRLSNHLLQKAGTFQTIELEIRHIENQPDTSVKKVFGSEISVLRQTLLMANQELNVKLRKQILIEDSINTVYARLHETNHYANGLLVEMRGKLTEPDLPAVWNSVPGNYTHTFSQTVVETFSHIKDSVTFFMKHNITGFVIYRILIFLLCLLPVHYFRRHKGQHLPSHYDQKFLQSYPTLASVVMGFAAIPLIFNHAPYAFLDFILITLTISVSVIFLKEHKYLSRTAFYSLLISYIVLKVIHFFSSPTFSGRLIFTASIFLILPMFSILKDIEQNAKRKHFGARTTYVLLLIQMSLGWVLMVLGYYPQGRQLFLGALDTFVLAIILYVTVYTLIDYLRLAAWLINSKIQSFSFNHIFIETRFKNWLQFFAVLFFISSYLKSIFVYEFVTNMLSDFTGRNLSLDSNHISIGNITFSLLAVAFGFYISFFLKHALLPVTQSGKSNYAVSQYVYVIRLLIVAIGFLVGLLVSGLSFSAFSVPVIAVGLGLGWALKDLLSNLIAGTILTFSQRIKKGDHIAFGDSAGKVMSIGSTVTLLLTKNNEQLILPNQLLLSQQITIAQEDTD